MTHLHIATQFKEGQGAIEMRPSLDEESWTIIRGLGINGINSISEKDNGQTTTTELHFGHAKQPNIDAYSQSIAAAMLEQGCEVSFGEEGPLVPPLARSQRLAGRILQNVRTKLV